MANIYTSLFLRENGVYYIQDKFKQKIILTKSTGIKFGTTPREIKANRKAAETYRDNHVKNRLKKSSGKEPELLSTLIDRYFEDGVSGVNSRSKLGYIQILRDFKKRGNKLINQYDAEDIDSYTSFLAKTVSDHTAHRGRRVLHTFFERLIKWKYLSFNPVKDSKVITVPEPDPTPFTKKDFEALYKVIDDIDYRDFALYDALTGLRAGEMRFLKPEHHIQDENGWAVKVVSNKHHKNKTGRTRYVRLHPLAVEIYERRKHKDYMFTGKKGRQINIDWYRDVIKKYCALAKLRPEYNIKSLRSTFGYWLLLSGASMEYISDQMGHSDVGVTQRHYVKFKETDYRGDVKKIQINI